jgi:hypothetical protein
MGKEMVYLINPRAPNPRSKALSRDQVEAKQAKAVRFAENVLDDEDKADELAALSPEEYAERRGLRLQNPRGKGVISMRKVNPNGDDLISTLIAKFDELPAKIAEQINGANKSSGEGRGNEQDVNGSSRKRRNPSSAVEVRVDRVKDLLSDRDELIDAIGDAVDALDDGDPDKAQDILDDVLGGYDDDDDENDAAAEDTR